MYSTDRNETREVFFRAWRNHREHRPLDGVEKTIVDVVQRHPEYQALLEAPDANVDRDYLPELGQPNPFLHLGLHIAIEEQLSIDQPPGIRLLYQQLRLQQRDAHAADHLIMECLTQTLWQAQRDRQPPDQAAYLDCVRQHVRQP
jgi:hypothetical protein